MKTTTITYYCKDELYTDFYKCDRCGCSKVTKSANYCSECGSKIIKTDRKEN